MWNESTAEALARDLLSGLGRRWAHASSVGRLAQALQVRTSGLPDAVVEAAWVHDIGYAPGLVDTRMHAIDGALALQRFGAPSQVVALVARHTGAAFEAEERQLVETLGRLPAVPPAQLDLLTFLDLVVGPSGELVTPEHRIEEILERYNPGDPVHRAVTRSRPALLASAQRARAQLGLSDEWPLDVAEGVLES